MSDKKRVSATIDVPADLAAAIDDADRILGERFPDHGEAGLLVRTSSGWGVESDGSHRRIPGTGTLNQYVMVCFGGDDRAMDLPAVWHGIGPDGFAGRYDDRWCSPDEVRSAARWVLEGGPRALCCASCGTALGVNEDAPAGVLACSACGAERRHEPVVE